MGAFIYFAWATSQQNVILTQQARRADRAERALCILRSDLQTRVDTSIAFLKEHPDGIPGIPAATLQQSIDNQQRTILALQLLECPETPT